MATISTFQKMKGKRMNGKRMKGKVSLIIERSSEIMQISLVFQLGKAQKS